MNELNKKLLKTPDLNFERLKKLKELFPDLFTIEGTLNPDELKKLVDPESVKESERFEFKWFGKSNAKRTAFTPTQTTLHYDEERSINPELSQGNMIIEGENLEVLKNLLSGYREKVKMIYIDPPYNTGKDFVYSDKWNMDKEAYLEHIGVTHEGVKVDTNSESNGRYHSDWLNLIYPRLLLSRQLLRDDGVIFISIDDNEVHHLRKVCDEVFGEENFVANFVWKSRQNKDNRNITGASIDHEYVVCYSKNYGKRVINGAERKIDQYKNPDNDIRGFWTSANMVGLLPEDQRPNCHYELVNPVTNINYGKPKMGWRYDQKTMSKLMKDDRIIWPDTSDGRPRRKVFLHELSSNNPGFSSLIGTDIFTRHGTQEIENIFEFRAFDFPKSSEFLKSIVNQGTNKKNDIILDFFAGSGTTAHAVMKLNAEDNGNRKFILVQLPELTNEKSEVYKAGYKKISDITIERNKRVIEKEGYKEGFKVYKLDKSNFPRVDFQSNPEFDETQNIELLKTYIKEKESAFKTLFNEEMIFDEVLLKNGFMLDYELEKIETFTKNSVYYAKDNNKKAIICLDDKLHEETLKTLDAHKDELFICLEQAIDTTMKWNLKQLFGQKLVAF